MVEEGDPYLEVEDHEVASLLYVVAYLEDQEELGLLEVEVQEVKVGLLEEDPFLVEVVLVDLLEDKEVDQMVVLVGQVVEVVSILEVEVSYQVEDAYHVEVASLEVEAYLDLLAMEVEAFQVLEDMVLDLVLHIHYPPQEVGLKLAMEVYLEVEEA